jgi:hypothetical protein
MKLIGNKSSIEIITLGKTNPNSSDEWDKRWIKVELKISLEGFISQQRIELLDGDFERLYNSIDLSLKNFLIPIEFETLEESIYLKGNIEQSGQVYWEGYTIYPIGNGNKLSFRFETELAQLDNLLVDLKREF